jgi:hypothetical protein
MAKAPTEIRSLARSHTEAAIRTLAAIMKQRKAPAAARISAACALLDRGWGRPDRLNADEAEQSSNELFLQILKKISAGEIPKGLKID